MDGDGRRAEGHRSVPAGVKSELRGDAAAAHIARTAHDSGDRDRSNGDKDHGNDGDDDG